MHVRDQRAFAGLKKVRQCIDECPAFALEIDLDEAQPGMPPALFQLPGYTTLHQYLPGKKYPRLRRILLKAFGIDLDLFSRLRPMAIIELLTNQLMEKDFGLVLDAYLWDYASSQGKTTFGIETLEEQQSILAEITLDVQLKMLRDIGKKPAQFRHMLNHMAGLYEAGDLKNLHRLSRKSAGGLRHAMLFDRNRIMAGRIAASMQEQPAFYAIGAAHLWGGKGVLRLLKQRGIRLEPITF